jgi:hypothetical protein
MTTTRTPPPDVEDRRRAALDGPTEDTDDMRMDVHLDEVRIPESTKWAVKVLAGVAGLLLSIITALVGWNLVETLAIQKSSEADKREIWIEIGKLQGARDVTDVRLGSAELRLNKLEDKP